MYYVQDPANNPNKNRKSTDITYVENVHDVYAKSLTCSVAHLLVTAYFLSNTTNFPINFNFIFIKITSEEVNMAMLIPFMNLDFLFTHT